MINSKRAEVSQIFVYLFSIIVIGFAGFLVINFIGVFSEDTQSRTNIIFFEELKGSYENVAKNWNSEQLREFRVTQDVAHACFIPSSCDTSNLPVDSDTVDTLIEGGDNVVLVSGEGNPLRSQNIGEFNANEDCFCMEPQQNRIELYILNDRNNVIIEKGSS